MTRLHRTDLPADRLVAEVVVACFFEDERPLQGPAALLDWRLNGLLTTLLLEEKVSGQAGEQILVRGNGKTVAARVLFVGGGRRSSLDEESLRGLLCRLLETCRRAGFGRIALALAPPPGMALPVLERLVAGEHAKMGERAPECLFSPG